MSNSLFRSNLGLFITFRSLHDLSCVGVGGGGGLAATFVVHVQQLVQVKPRPLHNLHLADVDVVQGVDTLASLLNVSGNGVRDELVDNLLQVGGADLSLDDINHLLPD